MTKENRRYPDQYMMRFPEGMRDELKALAKANGHSLNVEIVNLIKQGQNARNNQITLRDQFAIAVLSCVSIDYQSTPEFLAEYCYERADAMLAFRNKGAA